MMKWLFILLLLLNLVYFGWELDRQTSMDVTSKHSLPVIPRQTARLQFLNELPALPPLREVIADNPETNPPARIASSAAATAELGAYDVSNEDSTAQSADARGSNPGGVSQAGSATGACFSFGPVADEINARGLQDWLTAHASIAQLRHRDEQGRQLFWIYLSPQESRQEAMKTIRSIENKGIQDFRLINKGGLRNAISMGLFSSQDAVNRRLRELEKKGYKPVVVPYSDGKRVYWVDSRLPADPAAQENILNGYPSRFGSVPLKCTEIAIGSEYS